MNGWMVGWMDQCFGQADSQLITESVSKPVRGQSEVSH